MSKYIDADKAKNGIMKFVNEYGEIVGMFVNDFNILLERCAVDVEEVKHGHWIDGKRMGFDGTYHWFRQCSECLYEREDDTPEKDTNYCPNCGSRMDLDGDEE